MDNYVLRQHGEQWQLQKPNTIKAEKIFASRAEGLAYCKEFLPRIGGLLRVCSESGVVQEERSYPRRGDSLTLS